MKSVAMTFTTRFTRLGFSFMLLCHAANSLLAQSNIQQTLSVNSDGSSAHASAQLDVSATNKGMLVPRMTSAQRTSIASPATGLLVFDTNTNTFWFFNGTAWVNNAPATSLADADGDTKIQVEETADEDIIRFDLGGTENMVLRKNAGGSPRLELPNSLTNNFVGYEAGSANTTGNQNSAAGYYALNANTTGNSNTATGYSALYGNNGGSQNTAMGVTALYSNSTGNQNTATGAATMYLNTTGTENTANGFGALYSNTGSRNTAVGRFALITNTTGSNNTALGNGADVMAGSLSNAAAIGYNAKTGCSNCMVLGGTGADAVNVGISTNFPTYKLDVIHGGQTGARIRATQSYSVVDIDGIDNDAALRLMKNGAHQWNIRNRGETDDYLEIFEMGGGGPRFVIENGTGNVGIGETTDPLYRLDVLHSGVENGARIRSSASYSIVDIDAFNGDAALRFKKNGANQWSIRNDSGTDNLQFFELGSSERMRIENSTGKVVVNGDFTVAGTKMFTMDHPLDPANKLLMHAAVESNEVINSYSGNVTTDANGKAVVQLPDYYEALNKDSRYQLTVIGSFAQAIVSKKVSNNQFEIATSQPHVEVSWEVKGVRNDARMQKQPFVAEVEKPAGQRGKYFDPASHNMPASMGIGYDANVESSLNAQAPAMAKTAPPTKGGSLD